MESLTNVNPIANLLGTKFKGFIKTDIELKSGKKSQIVTLMTDTRMFDEFFMGINKALKSGGLAARWQHQLFVFRNGALKPSSKTAIITDK